MAEPLRKTPASSLYDADFHAWTAAQAAALRQGRLSDVDIENVAEEIEALGRSERAEIDSRLCILLLHLLKWSFQPGHRSASWRGTIFEQRRRLQRRLAESPSLQAYPASVLQEEYEIARLKAVAETGLPISAFPASCPFPIEAVLDADFYPEA